MIPVGEPRAVVRGENDPCFVVEAVPLQSVKDLPDRPIDLLDDVSIETARRFAAEFVAHAERDMRHAVGQIQEERAVLVPVDEFHRPLRIPRRQQVKILDGHLLAEFFLPVVNREIRVSALFVSKGRGHVLDQIRLSRPVVVRERESEEFIEPVPQRHEFGRVTQVPLAEQAGGIALLLEKLRQGRFLVAKPDFGVRTERQVDADPVGIATGQQGRTRG